MSSHTSAKFYYINIPSEMYIFCSSFPLFAERLVCVLDLVGLSSRNPQ